MTATDLDPHFLVVIWAGEGNGTWHDMPHWRTSLLDSENRESRLPCRGDEVILPARDFEYTVAVVGHLTQPIKSISFLGKNSFISFTSTGTGLAGIQFETPSADDFLEPCPSMVVSLSYPMPLLLHLEIVPVPGVTQYKIS